MIKSLFGIIVNLFKIIINTISFGWLLGSDAKRKYKRKKEVKKEVDEIVEETLSQFSDHDVIEIFNSATDSRTKKVAQRILVRRGFKID